MLADPNNRNVVYVAGDRQELPSANGCSNFSGNVFRGDASLSFPWQNVVCNGAQNTSPHADSRAMAFDAFGNVIQANDGGLYVLSNPNSSGRIWKTLNGNIGPTEFHSVAYNALSHTVIGGAQDTGTPMQNTRNSFTWTEFLQGDGGVVAIDRGASHPGASIRYTSFNSLGNFNRSTWNANNTLISGPTIVGLNIVSGSGAGKTIFQADPNIQFYTPYVLNAVDPTRMLIGTASVYGRIWATRSRTWASSVASFSSLAYGGRRNGQTNIGVLFMSV